VLGAAVSMELFVSQEFVVWLWTLGAFSGRGDLFDSFDGYVELSGFVPATHVGVETLKSMLLLEGPDLFGEVEFLASLSEIACDLVRLDFAHG